MYCVIIRCLFCCVCKQASQHFGASNCLEKCQALLSSLRSPPAFTTLRLNTHVSTANELCAQVTRLLSEVRNIKFIVFITRCLPNGP